LDILDGGALHHMHYRHRDYSPVIGRFLQHDPLQYEDGLNLYEYVGSNPMFFLDPYGLVQLDASCVDWGDRSPRNRRKLEDMRRSIKHACDQLKAQIENHRGDFDQRLPECLADYCSDSPTDGIRINCRRRGEGSCGKSTPGGYYEGETGEINICVDSFKPTRYRNGQVGPPWTYPSVEDGNKYTFGDTVVHEIAHACIDDNNCNPGNAKNEHKDIPVGSIPGFGGNKGYGVYFESFR